MKKILLGTTALIGATLLAGAAFAGEDPKVTVGGFFNFEGGYRDSNNDQNENSVSFRNDTEIHFNVAGKTDAGLGYGAEIDLEGDINGSGPNSVVSGTTVYSGAGSPDNGLVAHRTYGWLQGDQWGHVEFGSNDGVARTLKVDAANIARATGGIDGDFEYFADVNQSPVTGTGPVGGGGLSNVGAFAAGRAFITAPLLPAEHGPNTSFYSDAWGNDDKITYYTPRFSGFQLGVSYAPDLASRGETVVTNQLLAGNLDQRNLWEGGANYEGQFDQVGVAIAATGETASADNTIGGTQYKDIGAWNVGAKLSYMGFGLAGGYGDWSDSMAVTTAGVKADYWDLGASYETGPFGASVTYFSSEDKPTGQDNKFQDVSVGVDYKLAPGLTPFIEYTWYDIDPSQATSGSLSSNPENKGNVVLVGSQLSF